MKLTPKERMVVSLRADGLSREAIGERLKLHPRTVQNYLASAARKKKCKGTAELMVYVWRKRMAEKEPVRFAQTPSFAVDLPS